MNTAHGRQGASEAAIFYGCCLLACSTHPLILSVKDPDACVAFDMIASGALAGRQWRNVGDGRVSDQGSAAAESVIGFRSSPSADGRLR